MISSLAISVFAETSQYPTYMWTQSIKGKKIEFKPEADANGDIVATLGSHVSDEIKKILDTTNANSFIVYNRPGMTTENLVNTLVNNNKIGDLLKSANHNALERSYTDVTGVPVITELSKEFSNVKSVIINSKESLEDLKKEFMTAPKPFIHQYYIIDLSIENDSAFDELVFQIEEAFKARTLGNHVSVLAGSPLEHRRLQEVDIEPTERRNTAANDDVAFQYVTANILTKTLIALPIVFLLIVSMNLLFSLKTPTLFVDKCIDMGKMEK